MKTSKQSRPRWWRSLGFRLGAVVVVSIVIGDLLMYPVYGWVWTAFHPEELAWSEGWSFGEAASMFGLTVGYALIIGSLLAWAVVRFSLRRLRHIASEASSTIGDGAGLPGPFEESGKDEITQMAGALNSMRSRVIELVKRLEERDSRRSEWVAQVAHDLRTPLAALTTCLDRASDQLDRGTSETDELRELLGTARLDANRVGTLAEDLLEIARLEIEEVALTEPVLPGEIVQDVVRGLQPIATDAGIHCEVEIAPDVPVAAADGRLICRALENLVVNSLQHARGTIAVRAHGAGEKVRFEVEDDGPGLPERDGRVLFSELKQQRSRADSAGLGLIVAQRVAQAHGGEIGARNVAEGGAVVWFEIPVSPA